MLRLFTKITSKVISMPFKAGVYQVTQPLFQHLETKVNFNFGIAHLFKKTRFSGHHRHKGKGAESSFKKRCRVVPRLFKIANSNSLLRRIKIVGPRSNRRFKFKAPGARHLNRNSSKRNLMMKRMKRYIKDCDLRRVKRMIPNWQRQKLKRLH